MRFDKEAHLWDELPRRVELGKSVSEYVKKYISQNDEVLDFGCGTGLVSLNLCGEAKKIVGVDLSCKMVDIFNHKAKSINCEAIGLCEDVNNVNIKFDVIVASMVFHHIENIEEMLEILSSKLNNNGKLFIADLYEEDGTFHEKGNDDVHHFGFHKNSFENKYFKLGDFCNIYTINKHKNFDVYIWYLEKRV